MKRYNETDDEYRRRKQREDEEQSSSSSTGGIGIGIDMTTGQIEPTIKLGGGIGLGFNGDLTIGI